MSRRWLIDAMNVIGSRPDRWWNDPERAMREFATTIDGFAEATGRDITVVFDKDPGDLPPVQSIDIRIARRRGRNAADYEIEQIVAGADDAAALTVVTSDRRLVEKVRSLGARTVSSGSFRKDLDRSEPA